MARKRTGFFIGEAVRYGWESWKRQWLAFTGVVVTALVTPYIPGAIGTALGDEAGVLTISLVLLSGILSVLVSMGLLRVSLKGYAGEPVQVSDLFGEWRRLPVYLAGSMLYGLIVLGGTLLFVVPGLVWSIKFQYYAYLVLEGRGPVEALRESAKLTSGRKWDLLALQYVLSTLLLLGTLAAGVGLLAVIPVALIANAAVYRKLQQ